MFEAKTTKLTPKNFNFFSVRPKNPFYWKKITWHSETYSDANKPLWSR